ncbi:MAG: hypothetical protein PHS33_09580 [Candidatus Omnitrophica bacterium]|nr:hypothetical protein [Candidatus Omnitrophota bacterium]
MIKSQIGIENFTKNFLRKCGKPFPVSTHEGVAVKAEINYGRLIAKCPFCTGAELIDRNDKRFFCLSCFNKSVNGNWIRVEFPDNLTEIEAVLEQRTETNQNWQHGEEVMFLKSENTKNLGVV